MPLPLAHSLAGVAVFKGLDADGTARAWKRLLLAVVIANVADLDLIPGILAGEPNRYHHVGFSHSALFALAAAVLVGALAVAAGKRWPVLGRHTSAFAGTALLVGLLLLSHVVLDALNDDLRPPPGVPMWWPLSPAYVQIYPWFVAVAKLPGAGTALDFVASVLTVHNLYAMLWEFLTMAPLVVLVGWWRARRTHKGSDLDEPVEN